MTTKYTFIADTGIYKTEVTLKSDDDTELKKALAIFLSACGIEIEYDDVNDEPGSNPLQ